MSKWYGRFLEFGPDGFRLGPGEIFPSITIKEKQMNLYDLMEPTS